MTYSKLLCNAAKPALARACGITLSIRIAVSDGRILVVSTIGYQHAITCFEDVVEHIARQPYVTVRLVQKIDNGQRTMTGHIGGAEAARMIA